MLESSFGKHQFLIISLINILKFDDVPCHYTLMTQMDQHIVSILFVFVCSLVGSVGAYIISKRGCHQHPWLKSVVTMFSAGMMLSLAFVHITNEVIQEINKYVNFPLGACMVLSGLIVMIVIEHASHSFNNIQQPNKDTLVPLNECSHCVYHCHDVEASHSHACISTLNSSTLVHITNTQKSMLSVLMLEVACVFHSFFIGLSLGMSSRKTFTSLSIALCFHQLLEGVSVGSMSSEANMSTIKVAIFTFIYSITAPLGIAIGMFIDSSLVTYKRNQIIVLSFQGFAGGMLLYVALFQMIAEELSKKETHSKLSTLQKMSLYFALISGALSMCIIAFWL